MKKKRRSRQFKEKERVIDIDQARHDRRKRRKETVKKATQKTAHPMSKRRATKTARRRFVYLVIIIALIFVVLLTALHLFSLQKEMKAEDEREQALLKEKARLENELKQVNTEEYVEDKARSELHMVKPGEMIYIAPQEDLQTTDAGVADKEKNGKS